MEKERTSPWLILFRVVFTAALIACIMFIFRNSLENGAQSSARSQAVMQLVNSALAKVHLGPLSEHLIRKLAHFSEFALEGFLLMLCIRVYTKHFVRPSSCTAPTAPRRWWMSGSICPASWRDCCLHSSSC